MKHDLVLDLFIKALLREDLNPHYKSGILSIQQVYRLLEDPDFDKFSPEMKRFILKQQQIVDKGLKLQSY